MVVHSSYLNPWFYPFFGTLVLFGGQLFSSTWYPFTSNLGFMVFIISVLLLMSEIDKDMNVAAEFADFLNQVSKKGDAISMRYAVMNKEDCGAVTDVVATNLGAGFEEQAIDTVESEDIRTDEKIAHGTLNSKPPTQQ